MQISQSTALVTGANRGIGRSLVEALLDRGATRIYATARRLRTLDALVELAPDRIIPLALDVTDRRQVQAAAERARDVSLLINNAGALAMGSVVDAPFELVARDIDTNYYGPLHMIRAFAPALTEQAPQRGAAIVNVLTIVALASMPGLGAYNASKAAAWSLTQSARATLAPAGVQVIGVYPGAVDTDMIRDFEMAKTAPSVIAQATLDGIEAGAEDVFPDAMSQQLYEAWRADHKAVEHQFATM
jgi:NAD(P)-dependent dehydrogenase (short-subunit alcohol dehydrogenase family)